ncbi:ArnT family glycosyltransferase [Plantactinospora siamensis]|uniref:ArnT family glycosyltransferase n=1 Tax=Plantactinospora siamensis TaxID=555372 RepID=A0ABV6NSS8_9ACTN
MTDIPAAVRTESEPSATTAAPPVAWRWLTTVAGATALLLLAFAGRYGYHRDELYYRVAARHLAWGYDDQPPLVPALAGLADRLAGGSVVALRLPTALVVGVTVLLVGLLTREIGGDRRAQVLAAAVWATAPAVIVSGHLLSTTPFDIACWTAVAWLLARWVRTRDDVTLLILGPVVGVGLLAKSLPVLFLVALGLSIVLVGPRSVLRRPALWLGAAVAAALWAPNLWWQATNGWPQLEMASVIRADADFGGRLGLLPSQLLMLGPPVAALWIAGLWRLLRTPDARPYRFLGVAYLVVLALILITGGREYYPVGAYPALVGAGSMAALGWIGRATGRRRTAWIGAAVAVNGIFTAALGLPIYPARMLPDTPEAAINYDAGETIGWQQLTRTVAGVYDSIPADQRAGVVIMTGNYGEAGAIDRYGPAYGLPRPYSGHLAFWRWGPPPDTATGPVIFLGGTADQLGPFFGSVGLAARIDNGYGVDNDEQGTPVWLCRDPRATWSQVWPRLRHLS